MMAEGTGAVTPQLRPPEETYAGGERADVILRKAAAQILFARRLRDKTRPEGQALADLVRVQTQPYELLARTDPLQHISPFFRTIVWMLVPQFYALVSPLVSAVMVVDQRHTPRAYRGVSFPDFARAHLADSRVALASPFLAGISEGTWMKEVHPGLMAGLAQLPALAWAVSGLKDAPEAHELARPIAKAAFAQLMPGDAVMRAPIGLARPFLSARLDVLAAEERAAQRELGAISRLQAADARDDATTLALTIPIDWKLGALGAAKTKAALETLETLKRERQILDYTPVRDRPLARGANVLTLHLVLPVAPVLDRKLFG
jgi:hypothetical protein